MGGESPQDIEQSPKSSELSDPYAFRNSIKTEDELATIRKSRQGKGLERYHRRQNNVCDHRFRLVTVRACPRLTSLFPQLITYLLKPMEEHTEDAREAEEAARLPVRDLCSFIATL